MQLVKKLSLSPFFLIASGFLIYQLNFLFKSYDVLFSLSLDSLNLLITLSSLITLASFLFILFVSLSQDWKQVLAVAVISSVLPLILTSQPLNIILSVGIFISLLLSFLALENKLKTYLTFESNSLLGPGIRHLISLLVLIISLTFFLSINKNIQEKGFQIPDSLIDTAIKFSGPQGETTQQQTIQPQLTKEQLDLLKKNPNLLKQSGLDPKILDSLSQSSTPKQTQQNLSQNLIKQTIKNQLDSIIKPYLGIIPAVLAVLLFLTLQSFTSLLGLFIYPLLWIIFYILEKTRFISFTTEQRTVKKMVV